MDHPPEQNRTLGIVMPVLDDWDSLQVLVQNVEAQFTAGRRVYVAVDDGSATTPDEAVLAAALGEGSTLHILRLRANQGHQRAIALGLAYIREHHDVEGVIVMDSDGEDRPEDIPNLLAEEGDHPGSIVVASRAQRSEGLIFQIFYAIYKMVFRYLTGRFIDFGNFSYLPISRVDSVIYNGTVWNNFAASVLRSRAPMRFLPTVRGTRYFGSSKMNFTSLMLHGMSAISVFSDFVIGRIIILLSILVGLLSGAIAGVIGIRLFTEYFIPGSASSLVLFFLLTILNAGFVGFMVILMLLNARNLRSAMPSELLPRLAVIPAREVGQDRPAQG